MLIAGVDQRKYVIDFVVRWVLSLSLWLAWCWYKEDAVQLLEVVIVALVHGVIVWLAMYASCRKEKIA